MEAAIEIIRGAGSILKDRKKKENEIVELKKKQEAFKEHFKTANEQERESAGQRFQ